MIERNLELYLTVRLSVCRIKCCCFLSSFNCFSNHFNLISYFISFALCDLNTFYSSNVSMQSCFLSKSGWNLSSIDTLPPESHFATQCFDLMTGLNDVKLCTFSLSLHFKKRHSMCINYQKAFFDASRRVQWIFKATKLTFNLCQCAWVPNYITFWWRERYIILN